MVEEIDAPDPNPREPRLKAPARACDCHFHFFWPADRYPYDSHSRYLPAVALPESYFALQDTLGLSRGVLVNGGAYGTDTRNLVDMLQRYGDRLRGVMRVPDNAPTDDEALRLTVLGVRGIRVQRAKGGGKYLSTTAATQLFEHGWHVQFFPRDDLLIAADELMALPNDIVFDHFGGVPAKLGMDHPSFRKLLDLLDTGRVWVKLSAPMRFSSERFPYHDIASFARKLCQHAPDRVVWGSDWPHTNIKAADMPNDGGLFDLIEEWVPDSATRTKLLVDNPAKLYGFASE